MSKNYRVETVESTQKVLIMDPNSHPAGLDLKTELIKYDVDVHFSKMLSDVDLNAFTLIFILKPSKKILDTVIQETRCKFICIFFNQSELSQQFSDLVDKHKLSNVKVIETDFSDSLPKDDLDKILWFALSTQSEPYLHLYHPFEEKKPVQEQVYIPPMYKHELRHKLLNWKLILPLLIFIGVIAHLLYIPFLFIAKTDLQQSYSALQSKQFDVALRLANSGGDTLRLSKLLYTPFRPTYLLLSLSDRIDNIYQTLDAIPGSVDKYISTYADTQYLFSLLLHKKKTPEDKKRLLFLRDQISSNIDELSDKVSFLQKNAPDQVTSDKLREMDDLISLSQRFFKNFDTLFAKDATKYYLVLITDNYQLRPGGGYLQSFGILKVHDYTLDDITFVPAPSTQAVTKVDAPKFLQSYTGNSLLSVQDALIYPDFTDDYQKITSILPKAPDDEPFAGAILMTNSVLEDILKNYGDVTIPSLKDTINADNFLVKSQFYYGKADFLSLVAAQLYKQSENKISPSLGQILKQALDEKRMALIFDDTDLERLVNEFYWSGRTIKPLCTSGNANCVVDYLLSLDANFSGTPSNSYIKRTQNLKVSFDNEGIAHNQYTLMLSNEATGDELFNTNYRNYLQIMIPENTTIDTVFINDMPTKNYSVSDEDTKTIGLQIQIPPKSKLKIGLTYRINTPLASGKGVYQLIIQKQIGSSNSDINLTVHLPQNMSIINQNFSPLVKDNTIVYNSNISSDKIFFLELAKQ